MIIEIDKKEMVVLISATDCPKELQDEMLEKDFIGIDMYSKGPFWMLHHSDLNEEELLALYKRIKAFNKA